MGFIARPPGASESPSTDNLIPVVEGLDLEPGTYAVKSIVRAAGPVAGSCHIDTLHDFDAAETEVPPGTEIWVYDGFEKQRTTLFHGWVISYTLNDSADSGRSEYNLVAIDATFRLGDMSVFWHAVNATPLKVVNVLWDGFTLSLPAANISIQIMQPKVDPLIVVLGDDIRDVGGGTRPRSWTFSGQSAMQVFDQVVRSIPTAMWWIEPAQEKGEPDIIRISLRGQGPERLIFRGGDKANEMMLSGNINYSRVRNRITGYGDKIILETTEEDPDGNDLTLLKMWDESVEEAFFEGVAETDPETGQTVFKDSFWGKHADPQYAKVGREWALPKDSTYTPAWKTMLAENKRRATGRGDDPAPSDRVELWIRKPDYEFKAGGKDTQWSKVDDKMPYRVESVTVGPTRRTLEQHPLGIRQVSSLSSDTQGSIHRTKNYIIAFDNPVIYNAKVEITEDDGNGNQVPVEPDWKFPEFQVTLGLLVSDDDEDAGRLVVRVGYNDDEDDEQAIRSLPWKRDANLSDASYHKQQQVNARRQIYANGQPAGFEILNSSIDDTPRFLADLKQRVSQTGKAVRDLTIEVDGIDPSWSPGHVLTGIEETEIKEQSMVCVSVSWAFGGDVTGGPAGSDKTHLRFDNQASTAV